MKCFLSVSVCVAGVVVLLASAAFANEAKPRILTEKEAEVFGNIVVNRETRRQNYVVLERLIADKQALWKIVSDSLNKEHKLAPDATYTFTAADKTLYLVSTNNIPKGKEPKKTVIKKFKTDEESLPLRQLMAQRILIENQLVILNGLAEENREETLGWDAHLRKTFNLKPVARYEVKKRDDGAVELIELPAKEGD